MSVNIGVAAAIRTFGSASMDHAMDCTNDAGREQGVYCVLRSWRTPDDWQTFAFLGPRGEERLRARSPSAGGSTG
jgi:hypothetical protein